MDNNEISFKLTADVSPLKKSISSFEDDVKKCKGDIVLVLDKLDELSRVELKGLTKDLTNEFNDTNQKIIDCTNYINDLKNSMGGKPNNAINKEITASQTQMSNLQNRADELRKSLMFTEIANGVENLEKNFSSCANTIAYNVKETEYLNAMIERADGRGLMDIAKYLKIGIKEAEDELAGLQEKLIVAMNTDGVSPEIVSRLSEECKTTKENIDEMNDALTRVRANGGMTYAEEQAQAFSNKLESVKQAVDRVISRLQRMVINSAIFGAISAIRNAFSEATKQSAMASNTFGAIGNAIAGSLIPIVNALATAFSRAFAWFAGLVKFITDFDMLAMGVKNVNNQIKKTGTSVKKTKKSMQGMVASFDEINDIGSSSSDNSSGGGGVSSGGGADLSGQLDALKSMQELSNSFDFSWAEPLKKIFEFFRDNGQTIAIVLGVLAAAFIAVNVAMWLMSANPIVLIIAGIIAGIVALIAIINLCIKNWDKIKEVIVKVGQTMLNGLIWVFTKIGEGIKWLGQTMLNGIIAIGKFFYELGPKIVSIFQTTWKGITIAWSFVIQFFKNIFTGIVNIFIGIGNWFANIFTNAWNGVKVAWSFAVQFFKNIWSGIVNVFSVVINWFGGIFRNAWNVIQTIWSGVVIFFKNIWNGIASVFAGVGSWFTNVFKSAYNGIVEVFNRITGFFKGIWNSITGIFRAVGTAISDAIGGTIKKAVNGVLGTAVKIINGFITAINFAISLINAIPGVNIKKLDKLAVPSFDVGTNYVPQDMLAMIHKGERITPAKYNNDDWVSKGETDMSETNALLNEIINAIHNKNFNIDGDTIGRVSVNYIQNESRRRGVSVI